MKRDFSDHVISKVDKDKRTAAQRARDDRIAEVARAQVNLGAKSYDAQPDRLKWIKAAAVKLRELYAETQDDAGAVTFFGSLAEAHPSTLPGGCARDIGERRFAQITGGGE